jgi:preprotein translocase subunit SecF
MTHTGFIAARFGDGLPAVTENGMAWERLVMPVSAILFSLGLVGLFTAILRFVIDFIGGNIRKRQAK